MKTITLQNSKRTFFRLMFIFAFMGMSFSTFAATVYLKNGHNGTWETVSNWVTTSGGSTPYGSVPQPGDNVVIPSTVTTTALSVNSTVTINQLDLSKVTMTIQSGSFTVNHAILAANAATYPVKITGGSIVNQATMTVTGNTTAANFTTQTVYYLIDLENNATSDIFENKTGATLNLDNSGFAATTNNTVYTPTFFLINQYTITGKVILNGTVNLTNKTYQVQTASVPGYKQVVFKCGNLSKSTIDGTFTVGTPSAPFVGANLLYCTSATATITFPSTANITFNAEMGSGDTAGQMINYNGVVTNAGNITFNAPALGAPYTNGVNQYLNGIAGLTNTGTMNFTGKITNKAINISGTGGTTYVFNNSGTINVNSTAGCNAIAAYEGSNTGTYAAPVSVNAIFQLTNSGIINLYSTNSNSGAINIGNNDANSWFKNTSTGIINTNGLIASGFTGSINDGLTPKHYIEAVPPTSMKFYNAGTVNFDMALNTTNATNSVSIANGTTNTNIALDYAIINFVNSLAGTGGTVKGRGVFLPGALDNSTGTLSPGCGTTTMTYASGNTYTTTQVGTANIGQFNIQGASVALTGNASMDVNGATAATTGYDQIINSTASAVLGVAGVSLSVTNGGGYTPTAGTTFDLFKATGASGTRTGNFASTSFPAVNWSAGYATATANVLYQGTPTVTVTVGTYNYNGSPQGPNSATNTGTGSSYTFSYSGSGYGPTTTAPTAAGNYTATATVAANGNYISASSTATAFTIADASLSSDYFRTQTSGDWSNVATWQSSHDNSTWINATLTPTSSATTINVLADHEVTISTAATASTLNVNGGGKLTLNSGITLGVTGNFNINGNSDVTTGTFVDNGTTTVTGTTTVNQYLNAAHSRNWYISSPVSTATAQSGYTYNKRSESTNDWTLMTTGDALTSGTGYVVNPTNAPGTYTFTGGSLNTGNVPVTLGYSGSGVTKAGFNLVGNPYASHITLTKAATDAANALNTIWYRTVDSWDANATPNPKYVYAFKTCIIYSNGDYLGSPAEITNIIAPMQAFWVRTSVDASTLTFTNAMRSHQSSNPLKAPAKKDENMQLLRLQVSNGTNTDETVLYSNVNASNNFDEYDAPKMFNNSASIAEIYTVAGNEQLAINGLNAIANDTEIQLGFSTLSSGTFSLKASQISNFTAGTQVILKDYLDINNPVITDLSDGRSYSFTSDVTSNNTSRFTLIFHAPSVATGINPTDNGSFWISTNANGQIIVNGNSSENTSIAIYNAIGQRILSKNITQANATLGTSLQAGVYMVIVSNAGKTITKKIIID